MPSIYPLHEKVPASDFLRFIPKFMYFYARITLQKYSAKLELENSQGQYLLRNKGRIYHIGHSTNNKNT